jgi:site-specific DNA-adenine methylase
MWLATTQYPEMLKRKVRAFVPSVEAFDAIKSEFLAGIAVPVVPNQCVRIAVQKIALQQMSFSGLGQMAGGPVGGRAQKNGGIDSRWNPTTICKKIDFFSRLLRPARITNGDYSALLSDDRRAKIYLDPPYVTVGDKLYQHSLSMADHIRLSQLLRDCDHDWLLSYNDCPQVRDLYAFAQIERVETAYSTRRYHVSHELLISPPGRNRSLVGYRPTALAA